MSNFGETELEQNGYDLGRLENRNIAHDLRDRDVVDSDEFRFKLRITVLEEHGNHLLEIVVQFVERLALKVSPRKSWDETDKQTSVRIALNYCGVRLHGVSRRVVEK